MMSGKPKDIIFRHTVYYSGLAIELAADDIHLIEVNFLKRKKNKVNEIIPVPIKKAVLFLDDYFHGSKSKIEIVLNTESMKAGLNDNPEKLYLDMTGYTEKEIRIYRELLKIEPGKTVSYNKLALLGGISAGARFAGNCMAGNRFPVIIPCHRVIKSDGSMGNYTGGIEIKEFLLKHEKGKLFH